MNINNLLPVGYCVLGAVLYSFHRPILNRSFLPTQPLDRNVWGFFFAQKYHSTFYITDSQRVEASGFFFADVKKKGLRRDPVCHSGDFA